MPEKPVLLVDVDGISPDTCSLGDGKPLAALGLCGMHYRRQRLYGDPNFVQVIRGDTEAACWSHVEKGADDECWLWTGACSKSGYGKIQVGGKTLRAHVWAYTHFVGPIPVGLQLDHVKAAGCTHLNCVNFLRHLEPVTTQVNILRSDGLGALNARKTHCKRGHEFTLENIIWQGKSKTNRMCRTCRQVSNRDSAARRKARLEATTAD